MWRVTLLLVVLSCLGPMAGRATADFDVPVELTNNTGQLQENWPVVMRVYTLLGRNLPRGGVNPDGFSVMDAQGQAVACKLEKLPPYDQIGDDELAFVIPKIEAGQTLTFRVQNAAQAQSSAWILDLPRSKHNLLPAGSFEGNADTAGLPQSFYAGPSSRPGYSSNEVRALPAIRLSAHEGTVRLKATKPAALKKGVWYYFGAWSRTFNVSRFGYQAGPAAHIDIGGFAPGKDDPKDTRSGGVMNQCSTRDWLKTTFEYRGHTDWGMDIFAAKALADGPADIEFVLDQRKHYYMEPGKTAGAWWLDDAVFMAQPEVNVRFDKALEPHLKDGLFVFTRPANTFMGRLLEENNNNDPQEWCSFPFAHEKLQKLDRWALKGQRVTYLVGLYHTRPLRDALLKPAADLAGPDGAKLPVELVEYCPGYVGPDRNRYLTVLNDKGELRPAQPQGDRGVRYFFLTYNVPRDAKPGRYAGSADLLVDGKSVQSIPLSLRVQDMAQPVIKDIYVGIIYQGGCPLPNNEQMLQVYGRSGFSLITWFTSWMPYVKGPDGLVHIDEAALDKKMKQLTAVGITGGVGLYTDVQVDNKPRGPAPIIRMLLAEIGEGEDTTARLKTAYARVLKEMDGLARKHPDWPTIIHMNWDEPQGGSDPKMGWTNEILPEALTTLDVQFNPLRTCAKLYTMPAFDNPADWSGPELYKWVKTQSKDFGYCAQPASAEWSRYQGGMWMITSGARYMHSWHLQNANSQLWYDQPSGQIRRAISMICWAQAMDDLKAHRLLTEARRAYQDKKLKEPISPAVRAADQYLADVLKVFNGDHKYRWPIEPYLGMACNWGYEGFYDDWQEQMARHAAAIAGIRWASSD